MTCISAEGNAVLLGQADHNPSLPKASVSGFLQGTETFRMDEEKALGCKTQPVLNRCDDSGL